MNYKMRNITHLIYPLLIIAFLVATSSAQHRGDNLAFQGLAFPNESGVKALAMGGAYTSISGDINSIFHNPAGLADIPSVQFSISANKYKKQWRENQVYRTNRFFLNLPFYLEGLYVPNPANNGQWDYDIFNRERDSTYVVQLPDLGHPPFSKEAADWKENANNFLFDQVALAVPFKIGGRQLVVSAAYNRKYDVLDFDRNDTYLDPHIGYDEYGVAERVANDTLHMNWYKFMRRRTGHLRAFTLAAGYNFSKHIKLGLGMNYFAGQTEDAQYLDKVGWFDLVSNNRFRFSYDVFYSHTSGTSKFKATQFNVGTLLKFDHFSMGLDVALPHTLKRTWSYSTTRIDSIIVQSIAPSGEDEMQVPPTYSLGLSFNPIKPFIISFDFESIPYSQAKFQLASNDSTHRNWVDQNTVRFGVEYRPMEWLSLLAGYRNLPAIFVPDGAAFKDRGPAAESYTMGLSLNTGIGRFDIAYEIRILKYYDSYYSNTNYAFESFNNLLVGYTVNLQ